MKRKGSQPAASVKKRSARAASPPSTIVHTPPPSTIEWPPSALRCWSTDDPDMQPYHDSVWGRPETNEFRLFQSQTLQLMQCGVSWTTVWRKRHHFERAFKFYDVNEVARFSDEDINDLMMWPDGTIIRNRSKLRAVVQNARIICAMRAEADAGSGPSFADLLWNFCPANSRERLKTIDSVSGSHMRSDKVPSSSYETRDSSDGVHPSASVCALSKELKKRGFGFMAPTTVLSFMQAVGLMNHHSSSCCAFQRNEREVEALVAWRRGGRQVGLWQR